MTKLPIGVQDFTTLREENFVYVDKTRYLYNLITNNRVYFLSRPRRFGKSLLVSTLEAILKGKKVLFNDLWIAESDYDWQEYPVIRIDMALVDSTSVLWFEKSMRRLLLDIATRYAVRIEDDTEQASGILDQLINALAKINKVVVLIDEYDKPILDHIDNLDLTLQMRNILRQFYTILKSQDGNIKLSFLTGVTKFSKVSVFSGLNNLQDLTLDNRYASMLGYTQQELETVFSPWIQTLSQKFSHSREEELDKIKQWYNGYQFSSEGQRVYNPFSTLLLFEQQEYRPHWFATGTPTFLLKLIEQQQFNVSDIQSFKVTEEALTTYDVDHLDIFSLLFQTGYLTIAHYRPEQQRYELNYPNREVEKGFTASLLQYFTKVSRAQQDSTLFHLVDALLNQQYSVFFTELQHFFSSIPYDLHIKSEKYYQNAFYFIFKLIGIELGVEVHTSTGRIDAVIELENGILIFEFKLDQSADVALQQIHQRNYPEAYKRSGKPIHLFGVEFSSKERNILHWKTEILQA